MMIRRLTEVSVTPLRHSFREFFTELIRIFISVFFPGRVVSYVKSIVGVNYILGKSLVL